LVERFSERHLVVVAMLASAACMVALLGVGSPVAAVGVAVALGLASRGESALVLMLVAQYYGRRSYGAISGFLSPFQMIGLGVGPLIASLSFDLLGSYGAAFLGFALAFLLAALLIWSARQPALPRRARALSAPALQPER
jgi:MFS family permease